MPDPTRVAAAAETCTLKHGPIACPSHFREAVLLKVFLIAVIPTAFLVVDAFCYAMLRGDGLCWDDWHKGLDAILATVTSALAILPDKVRAMVENKTAPDAAAFKTQLLCGFSAFTFFLFVAVFFIHQDVARRERSKLCSGRYKQFWLLGVANLIGFGAMVCFLLLIQ